MGIRGTRSEIKHDAEEKSSHEIENSTYGNNNAPGSKKFTKVNPVPYHTISMQHKWEHPHQADNR